jgi:hypothetical protein
VLLDRIWTEGVKAMSSYWKEKWARCWACYTNPRACFEDKARAAMREWLMV